MGSVPVRADPSHRFRLGNNPGVACITASAKQRLSWPVRRASGRYRAYLRVSTNKETTLLCRGGRARAAFRASRAQPYTSEGGLRREGDRSGGIGAVGTSAV
jgi:hypothetical protein